MQLGIHAVCKTPNMCAFRIDSFEIFSHGIMLNASDGSALSVDAEIITQGIQVGHWCIVRDNEQNDVEIIDPVTFGKRYIMESK